MTGLRCTVCRGREAFATLRLEITGGAATYLVCSEAACIAEASARAQDNLLRASSRVVAAPHPGAIDVEVVEAGS